MQIWPYIPVHMSKLAWWLVLFLAILQAGAMVMEIFCWHRVATDVGGYQGDIIRDTWKLGANMGLYNGFLAAGLAWSLLWPQELRATVAIFFVSCVVVAGVFGAFTVSWLLLIQALLAMAPLVALLI